MILGTNILSRPEILKLTLVASTWTAFGSNECKGIDIRNFSASDIEFRINATGEGMPIPAGQTSLMGGIQNSNQIQVRSTAAVDVHALIFNY